MKYKDLIFRFIRLLVVTAVLIIIVALIFYSLTPSTYYTTSFPYLLGFFIIASIIVYHFMLKAIEKRPARFVNSFMLATLIKLFVYMAVMITYALLNREEAMSFIVTFFVLYVIFTIVEVAALLKVNREYAYHIDE